MTPARTVAAANHTRRGIDELVSRFITPPLARLTVLRSGTFGTWEGPSDEAAPAAQQPGQEQHNRHDQEHMDERTDRVTADEAKQPQDQQNHGNGVQHGVLRSLLLNCAMREPRSRIRPARPAAWRDVRDGDSFAERRELMRPALDGVTGLTPQREQAVHVLDVFAAGLGLVQVVVDHGGLPADRELRAQPTTRRLNLPLQCAPLRLAIGRKRDVSVALPTRNRTPLRRRPESRG